MNSLAIVIPAYKATYFRKTLDSIANQTDKRFTLYIGDDCSPNNLEPIVDEYREHLDIVYHRFEDNVGGKDLVSQWERCISMTTEEPYIWLFSDDDIMGSSCVADFYRELEQGNIRDIYRFNVNVIDVNDKIQRKIIYPNEINSRQLYIDKIAGKLECFVVEFIFSRDVYNKYDGFVKFDLAWGSDLATWVKFSKRTNIFTLKSPGISWRSSGENISTDFDSKTLTRKVAALVECLKWGENIFNDKQVKSINQKGLISRLSTMGVRSTYSIGSKGLTLYASNHLERAMLLAKYTLYYYYKKLRNVF